MRNLIRIFAVFISTLTICRAVYGKEPDICAIYGFKFDNRNKITESIQQLKNAGINAFFIDYRDRKLTETLHKYNMYVFSEVSIFVGESYWKKDLKTRPVNAEGNKISKVKWYAGLCPNQDWVRKEKLSKIRHLITNYNIDGIWLDFIRYPCHWEVPQPELEQTCFCDECLEDFQRETKIKIPQTVRTTKDKAEWILKRHEEDWIKWKCRNITLFVKEVRQMINDNRPGVILGIFTVPWRNTDNNNAIEKIIGQNYVDLAEYVDVFSPMAYHKMCNKSVDWILNITDYAFEITGKKVFPIIQTQDIDRNEFDKMFDSILNSKAEGLIIFNSNYFAKEKMADIVKIKIK